MRALIFTFFGVLAQFALSEPYAMPYALPMPIPQSGVCPGTDIVCLNGCISVNYSCCPDGTGCSPGYYCVLVWKISPNLTVAPTDGIGEWLLPYWRDM
jgi:hypothetical protein